MKAPVLPAWFDDEIRHVVGAEVAHVVLLHGDVHGLFPNPDAEGEDEPPYLSLRRFLDKVLDARPLVVSYNIASGLSFLTSGMARRFRALTGLEPKADPQDPVASARASLAERRGLPKEPEACLPLVEAALQKVERAAAVIWSVHAVAPVVSPGIPLSPLDRTNLERLKNWARDEAMQQKQALAILVSPHAGDVHRELRQPGCGIHPVEIPRPLHAERATFIRKVTGRRKFRLPEGLDAEVLARATQGMSLRQLRELFLRAKERKTPLDLDFVKARKGELLNQEYGDVMDIVEPDRRLEDLGGCEHVKAYFRGVLDAIQKGERRLVPMGVTLMGPPGTGKTALVEALAGEAGFNFVKIRNVRSMWVGESESRMESLIGGLRSLAPVVVMNDEADLAEQGRDAPRGDSGVSERLMKMWMELLSDPRIRGEVIVISCTNRPDRIDPALKRSGRSDERILLPMPSWEERVAILQVQFRRHRVENDLPNLSAFGEATEGMSGADIEKVVLSAYRFAVEAGRGVVRGEDLTRALRDFIPSASQAEIDRMTLAGVLESSSRRLLPRHVKDIVDQIARRKLVEDMDDWMKQIHERQILEA